MRIALIGAGVVGVTTAHELSRDGHETWVFERQGGIAAEGSFAQAGLSSPGYLVPSALLGAAAGGSVVGQWLSRRGAAQAQRQALAGQLHALARYSHERLLALQDTLALECEQQRGLLVLLRDKRELVAARAALKQMAEWGETLHLVDADRARLIEPGLDPQAELHAAVQLPQDASANGRLFTQLLKAEAQRLGARFHLEADVAAVQPGDRPSLVLRQPLDEPLPPFDAVVVCAAQGSAALLAPLGLKLPLSARPGHSVTAPLQMREHSFELGPRSALFDARHRVAITRLGDRVRVAASGEKDAEAGFAQLYRVLEHWFPGAAQTVKAQQWSGSTVSLPDGAPLLGPSHLPGVWLNLAHGDQGWALACGSARALADQIAGKAPAVDVSGLSPARLR